MSSEQQPVFVTGASGLVGSALIRKLLQKNIPVKALFHTRPSSLLSKEEAEQVDWVRGDVLDISLLMDTLPQCSQVYHCAAIVSFHPSRRQLMYQINVEGTANMVNAALECGIKKMVHVSSVASLGKSVTNDAVNEKTEWTEEHNTSQYGKTKYLAEMEVWRGISEGLSAVIVNPAIILGESNWESGSTAIFKKVWQQFPFYTTGSNGFVDVVDVAEAMVMLMESDIEAERFILAAEHHSYQTLMIKIAEQLKKKAPSVKAPKALLALAKYWETIKSVLGKEEPLITAETVQKAYSHSRYDSAKILQQLPSFRYTPLDITLQRTCIWLMQQYGTL
jgi:nucleoside-diphosphate-sugar epimerase